MAASEGGIELSERKQDFSPLGVQADAASLIEAIEEAIEASLNIHDEQNRLTIFEETLKAKILKINGEDIGVNKIFGTITSICTTLSSENPKLSKADHEERKILKERLLELRQEIAPFIALKEELSQQEELGCGFFSWIYHLLSQFTFSISFTQDNSLSDDDEPDSEADIQMDNFFAGINEKEFCDVLSQKIKPFIKSPLKDKNVQNALMQIKLIADQFSEVFEEKGSSANGMERSEVQWHEDITQLKRAMICVNRSVDISEDIKKKTFALHRKLLKLYAEQAFGIEITVKKDVAGRALELRKILEHIIAIKNAIYAASHEALKHAPFNERVAIFNKILIKEEIDIQKVSLEEIIENFIQRLNEIEDSVEKPNKHEPPPFKKLKDQLNALKDEIQPWIPQQDGMHVILFSTPEEEEDTYSYSDSSGDKSESEKRDTSSSFNPSFVATQVVGFFGEQLESLSTRINAFETANPTTYKVIRAIAITTLVLGVVIGVTAITWGIGPAALAISGAIAAHAAIAESVVALGALCVAGFFGRKCGKKEREEEDKLRAEKGQDLPASPR